MGFNGIVSKRLRMPSKQQVGNMLGKGHPSMDAVPHTIVKRVVWQTVLSNIPQLQEGLNGRNGFRGKHPLWRTNSGP